MDNLCSCRKDQDIVYGMNLHYFYNNKTVIKSILSNAINMVKRKGGEEGRKERRERRRREGRQKEDIETRFPVRLLGLILY